MIYITGDTHGDFGRFVNFYEKTTLTKKDYVIVAGDFGLLWNNSSDSNEKFFVEEFNHYSWTTLFVEGNHDNYNRLKELKTVPMFGGPVGMVSDSIFHLKRGEVYTIDGRSVFCFGGAKSIDKHLRTEGVSWWKEEEPSYAECDTAINNLDIINNKVDIIITHTAPASIVRTLDKKLNEIGYQTGCSTSRSLEHVKNTIRFKKWYCGHFHVDVTIGDFRFLYTDIVEI